MGFDMDLFFKMPYEKTWIDKSLIVLLTSNGRTNISFSSSNTQGSEAISSPLI